MNQKLKSGKLLNLSCIVVYIYTYDQVFFSVFGVFCFYLEVGWLICCQFNRFDSYFLKNKILSSIFINKHFIIERILFFNGLIRFDHINEGPIHFQIQRFRLKKLTGSVQGTPFIGERQPRMNMAPPIATAFSSERTIVSSGQGSNQHPCRQMPHHPSPIIHSLYIIERDT